MSRSDVCIQMCESMYQIPARICCTVLLCIQGGILNYYLVHNKASYAWYAWIGADIALLFVFIVAFWISYKHLMLIRKMSGNRSDIQLGSLPIGYFAWIVYSAALSARVAIIFKEFAYKLDEVNFFGPNTLKVTIGSAGVIFILLLMTHHDAGYKSERQHFINELTWTIVFDILDSVDMLEVLFDTRAKEDLADWMELAIISVACINFILPAFPLATLSQSHFGHKKLPEMLITLHKLIMIFIINLPMMLIRLLLWHILDQDVSIFVLKNAIVISLILYEFYDKRRTEMLQPAEMDTSITYKKGNYDLEEGDFYRESAVPCVSKENEDTNGNDVSERSHKHSGSCDEATGASHQMWIR